MERTSDPAADDERAVVLLVTCGECGAEFEWNVGVDVEDSSCPACRLIVPETSG